MRTYKYKLLSAKRNQKLHRQINAGALAWNHCVAALSVKILPNR